MRAGRCIAGVDQAGNAAALEGVLLEDGVRDSKTQAARIIGWTII